jgi:hypothetical protein
MPIRALKFAWHSVAFEEDFVSAALDAACAKVGRYLYEFALLEREINTSIVQILDLKSDAADVVSHSLDFFKKVNLLKIVANETAPKEDRDELQDLFNDIAKLNEGRILMAHGAFEPAQNDGVQFRVTSARSGAVKVRDPLWDKKQFEDVYAKLQSTRESVKQVRPSLTVTISQEGKSELLSAYTYGSLMSTNVGGSYY